MVGDLTRIFCAALEAEPAPQAQARLALAGRRCARASSRASGRRRTADGRQSEPISSSDPVGMLRLFHVAQEHDLDIHPARPAPDHRRTSAWSIAAARRSRGQPPVPGDADLAQDPGDRRLRRMNEAGVFGRFIPDFGRVVAQMQYDMYHVYTVDEHTIFAIGILHQIEQGELKDELPLASTVVHNVAVAPRALSRRAAARHRQGPRRRSFGARRRGRAEARPAARPQRRGDRDRRLAGALASADEQHRVQARHRPIPRRSTISSPGCNRRSGCACCWC